MRDESSTICIASLVVSLRASEGTTASKPICRLHQYVTFQGFRKVAQGGFTTSYSAKGALRGPLPLYRPPAPLALPPEADAGCSIGFCLMTTKATCASVSWLWLMSL
jgi:hypothetical protein